MIASSTREGRRAAARAWDRSFGFALAKARADALVQVLSGLEAPTLGDLLAFVGEQMYEIGPDRVDVALGDLSGRPGRGPTVAVLMEQLDELTDGDLGLVLHRPLVGFVD